MEIGLSALLVILTALLHLGSGDTDPNDAAVLRSMLNQWENAPPTWGQSDDPCGTPWEGVSCDSTRVTELRLSTMGIKGTLNGDVGQLTELQSVDLSYNGGLSGPLSANIGNLKKLTTFILAGCSFSGSIPQELGNLKLLSFLALNSNKFSGRIPASLGLLSNLYWLDLADNQLTGSLPVSTNSTPGLDLLVGTKHFHFNKNQLSGEIPEQLFGSQMTPIHILFDSNQFTGSIPTSLGLVKSLEVLRLDNNNLGGVVPSNINNLTKINELNLANNELTGSLPDLTGMNSLNYVDLSNNSFSRSEAPGWFTTMESLTALVIESGGLLGQIPEGLFSLPQLQQVLLDNNQFNGTLNMSSNVGSQLQLVSFRNNSITGIVSASSYSNTLMLYGNPVCNPSPTNTAAYCLLQQQQQKPYTTSLATCGSRSCPQDQKLDPRSCSCAHPYQGSMVFRAPYFRDLTNATLFQQLEKSLWTNLSLAPSSVYISDLHFNSDNYLEFNLALFPSNGMYFKRSEVLRIGFDLSNQTYKPPTIFGPFYFLALPYTFSGGTSGKTTISTGVIAGIAAGCIVLVIGLVCVGIYALLQKKKAQRASIQSTPFATWGSGGKDDGSAPQLKGTRWFPFDEIKKCTNNFSDANEIGSGGYGKVYRGILSREQMLVYEYIPNGTLRENLIGRGGRQLDWKKRLRVALGSARGLAYLHELANPPIIHRDVKSTNILLDESLNAKVADFGLSKLVSDSQKGHVSTQVKGTLGYLDPEYYMTQQLSEKSDAYSFGVVMLELISARQPIEKGKYIVREVRMVINDYDEEWYGLKEIVDPTIRNTGNLKGFRRFVELAMRCVEESAANRPTMNEAVKEIETILQSNGFNTQASSASSSTTDFGNTHGAPRHPYSDHTQRTEESSGAFEYSGGYSA
ncbi:hypothetical protein OPV22_009886 [Ensete ventricosum]|uniref:non-specific serine/threonine protein kinase n=1 Tax=Ensete ventricosum TaxID=4639 RepID=A0AAV8RI03_ENSVE|nr:hypothetical protein OPV22_009886 [Ensete ventricosum]